MAKTVMHTDRDLGYVTIKSVKLDKFTGLYRKVKDGYRRN
jgi:hypothetical protein